MRLRTLNWLLLEEVMFERLDSRVSVVSVVYNHREILQDVSSFASGNVSMNLFKLWPFPPPTSTSKTSSSFSLEPLINVSRILLSVELAQPEKMQFGVSLPLKHWVLVSWGFSSVVANFRFRCTASIRIFSSSNTELLDCWSMADNSLINEETVASRVDAFVYFLSV